MTFELNAESSNVGFESTLGENLWSEILFFDSTVNAQHAKSGNKNVSSEKTGGLLSVSGGLQYSKSNSTGEHKGARLGMSWIAVTGFKTSGSFSYFSSPTQGLVSFGPEMKFGYRLSFLSDDAKMSVDEYPFVSGVGMRFLASQLTHSQLVSAGVTVGTSQIGYGAEFTISFGEWLDLTVSHVEYHYDADISRMASFAKTATQLGLSDGRGLSTLQSFPARTTAVDFAIVPNSFWEILPSARYTVRATDASNSTTLGLSVQMHLSDRFTVGPGLEYTYGSDSPYSTGLLGLEYSF
ncbi:MAG: hypothetical protein ABL958_05125 [Bdellovibrionia bacterium]